VQWSASGTSLAQNGLVLTLCGRLHRPQGFLLQMLIFVSPWHCPQQGRHPDVDPCYRHLRSLVGAIVTAIYAIRAVARSRRSHGQAEMLLSSPST